MNLKIRRCPYDVFSQHDIDALYSTDAENNFGKPKYYVSSLTHSHWITGRIEVGICTVDFGVGVPGLHPCLFLRVKSEDHPSVLLFLVELVRLSLHVTVGNW